MSHLLTWSKAARSDRDALRAFTCTRPPRKVRRFGTRATLEYERPWERFVQAKVHQMNPPAQPPDFLLLGKDGTGELGGVVFYEELDGPGQIEVHVAAVAMPFRGLGGGWADEMMTSLLDAITTRALESGIDLVSVSTWIHERNRASQAMGRRFGMRQVAERPEENLQRWTTTILVAGAELDEPLG